MIKLNFGYIDWFADYSILKLMFGFSLVLV